MSIVNLIDNKRKASADGQGWATQSVFLDLCRFDGAA
jgi:hypothetical protein